MENSNTTMEDDNKKKLINETVTGRPLTIRKALRYAAAAAICGIAFGAAANITQSLIASFSSAVQAPAADKAEAEDDAVSDSDHDADAAGTSGSSDTASEEISTDAASNETSAAAENAAAGIDDDKAEENTEQNTSSNSPYPVISPADKKDYRAIVLDMFSEAAENASASLVSVTVTSQTNTWFDSEMESTDTFSGIIISNDSKEILILTPYFNADGKTVKVAFNNGSTADALVKQSSAADSLTVITVSAADSISEDTLETIAAIKYGDTSKLRNGTPVIAVGSPLGVADSCTYGIIGYTNDSESGIDCVQHVFYTDAAGNPGKGTFILDYDGGLIGVASPQASDVSEESGYMRVVSIQSLERNITSLMSGSRKAELGIIGIDVNFGMKYSNVPEGVYISDVVADSTAYNAGIRHGDVITSIADRTVTDLNSLSRILSSLKPGVSTTVTIMRGSVNSEYREMNFDIVLGER